MALLDEIEIHEKELKEHIIELRKKFIDGYIPAQPAHTPDIFGHEVQAFCLLAHAAFEHFVEKISLLASNQAVDNFVSKNSVSHPLLALSLFYKSSIEHAEEKQAQDSNFMLLKEAVETANKAHGKAIFLNHGFSLEYLRKSLTPIGVNIPKDPRFESSLKILTDARGSFAHTLSKGTNYFENKGRAKSPRILTPEDARDSASDCQELCISIARQVKLMFPQKAQHLVEREARLLKWKASVSAPSNPKNLSGSKRSRHQQSN